MKKILCISGSARAGSNNIKLINSIIELIVEEEIDFFDISKMPLFIDRENETKSPDVVKEWKMVLNGADAIIVTTPEYLHNIPAALKNAFEWIAKSGELANKRVLPITFTPAPPRGIKAMQSLIWTLLALDATVVTQMPLYQSEMIDSNKNLILSEGHKALIQEAINLLTD